MGGRSGTGGGGGGGAAADLTPAEKENADNLAERLGIPKEQVYERIQDNDWKQELQDARWTPEGERPWDGNSLSKSEALSVTSYGNAGNPKVNEQARGTANHKGVSPQIKDMDRAIKKESTGPITVHRGIERNAKTEKLFSAKPGDTITDKGFQSTTTSRSIANEYAGKNGMVMKIHSKSGGLDMHKIKKDSLSKKEKEIVLPRGKSYKVTKVSIEKGVRVVEVREI